MRIDDWKVSFTSKNPTGTIAMDHNWGRLKVDEAFRWSQTHFDSGAGRDRDNGELQLRTKDPIGFVLDYSNPHGKVFTQTAGPDVTNAASYTPFVVTAHNATTQPIDQTSAVLLKRDSDSNTNEVSANVNASYLLPTEYNLTLKTGLDTINRRVHAWVPSTRRWYGVVGSTIPTGTGLVPLTEYEIQQGGARMPVFDPAAINTTLGNTALWTEDINFNAAEKYRSTRIMEEGVDSAYLQGSGKFGRLSVLTGVRTERVSTYTFFYVAPPVARRQVVVNAADPVEAARRASIDYLPSSTKGKYQKYFPSAHLAYDLTKNLKLRASWSNSYGRPRLQDMVASPTAVDTPSPAVTAPGTVTIGNPNLRPALAKNLDFRIDYAMWTSGFFSARVFRKDIRDYVGSSTNNNVRIADGGDNGYGGQYVGYQLINPLNIGTTRTTGIELDFRQQLTFLPGALKGLSVRANYTNDRTSAVFLGVPYANGQVVGTAGQWYIPRTYNVGLQYYYRKFGANLDMNYTCQFPIAFGFSTLGTNQYREARKVYNSGLTYRLTPEVTGFLNVSNITQADLITHTSFDERHRQYYVMPRALKLGVTGRF